MLRLTFTDIEKQALAYERTHHPPPRVRRKMDVLWLKSQGLAHQNIARLSGVSTKTMRGYFRDYIEDGIEGLKVLRFRRPQSALVAHQQMIESYFRDHPPASINEAIAAIGELTGLTRSPTQVRRFLKDKCAMKRLKTGGLPAKADPAVKATFKEQQLKPRLAQAQAGTRSVFFVDAAHFVLGAFMSVLWCVARVWIKAPSGRQRFNVLGALNAVTKELITVVNSTYINSHCVCELLEKLAAVTPKRPITVVLDNARYQRCALVQTRADALNIELRFLPAYSPNLNLIERLWKFVKKQCLYAKHYPDFGASTSAIQRCLRETLTIHKEALSSFLTLNFQTFEKAHF